MHPQVFASAKVACDARCCFVMQLTGNKISFYCSLAIPSSLRLSLRIASPLPKPKKRSSSALFALQESRDCIRKFLQMQKLRVTLAVVLMCNFLKAKSLITVRSLFRPHFRLSLRIASPLPKPKKRSSSAHFALQESRDCIRKFLRMQKLRVTLAVVLMCNFLKAKSLITVRSLFRPHFRSLFRPHFVRPCESRLHCQKPKKAQFFCAFCFAREPRLHPQVFANAKVACDAFV